jgi:hypothetical protein
MTRKILIITASLFFAANNLLAQQHQYAHNVIDTLTSESYQGRGFINGGAEKAAQFVVNEFVKLKLQNLTPDYTQPFTVSGNTLPGTLSLKLNKHLLKPGYDYLVSASSPSIKGKFKVIMLDSVLLNNKSAISDLRKRILKRYFVFYDRKGVNSKEGKALLDSLRMFNVLGAAGYGVVVEKLTWGAGLSTRFSTFPTLSVLKESLKTKVKNLTIEINAQINKDIPARNVIGFVPGSERPDSFLVVTAHYDHLGLMGKGTYFPGANDNASGVASLLDLASWYGKPENKPRYSMVFIAFCGEEAGLLGSYYYVAHPLFPLKKIKFLINLDMMGTGSDGLSVVNGTVFKKEAAILTAINDQKKYLKQVFHGGPGCASDHCPFYEKDVPCFFFFTRGEEYGGYHSVNDRADKLAFTYWDNVTRTIKDFLDSF